MTVKSTVFNASAGTGKTYQVTNLYNALVFGEEYPHEDSPGAAKGSIFAGGKDSKVNCAEILMLTFARNAASEMRMRVAEQVEEALATTEDEEKKQECWRVLRALSGANISTIHSFAQKLLMENAVAAGISPSVRLVEEDEKDELFGECAEIILRRELGDSKSELRSVLQDICYERGTQKIIESAIGLIDKCRDHGLDLATADADELVVKVPPPALIDLADLHAEAQTHISAHIASGKACKAGQTFCEAAATILEDVKGDPDGEAVAVLAKKILGLIKGSWGSMKPAKEEAVENLQRMVGYLAFLQLKVLLFFGGERSSLQLFEFLLSTLEK